MIARTAEGEFHVFLFSGCCENPGANYPYCSSCQYIPSVMSGSMDSAEARVTCQNVRGNAIFEAIPTMKKRGALESYGRVSRRKSLSTLVIRVVFIDQDLSPPVTARLRAALLANCQVPL